MEYPPVLGLSGDCGSFNEMFSVQVCVIGEYLFTHARKHMHKILFYFSIGWQFVMHGGGWLGEVVSISVKSVV